MNSSAKWTLLLVALGAILWAYWGITASVIFFIGVNYLLVEWYMGGHADRSRYMRYLLVAPPVSMMVLNYLQSSAELISPYVQVGLSTLLTLLFWGICYYYSRKWKRQE